jgi:hypothetical protein
MHKYLLSLLAVVLLSACGDKVPESKAAKEVGNAPKQTVDKAAAGVADAMGKAAERSKDEEEKKQ